MWPLVIVGFDPEIEIVLQVRDRGIELLAEGDAVKLIEDCLVEALADSIIRHDACDAFGCLAILTRNGVMVSPSGTRASGARRCGQAADRRWAESPSSLHGRPC